MCIFAGSGSDPAEIRRPFPERNGLFQEWVRSGGSLVYIFAGSGSDPAKIRRPFPERGAFWTSANVSRGGISAIPTYVESGHCWVQPRSSGDTLARAREVSRV